MEREIERNPRVPELNDELIRLLTTLCFRPDDPLQPADLIFLFSTPLEADIVADLVDKLLEKKISDKVFITGGIPPFSDASIQKMGLEKPESSLVLERLDQSKYPGVKFFHEDASTNTLENVTEALKVFDFSKYEKMLFVFKSHAARRGYLTLRKFLLKTKLTQKTFSARYPGTDRELNRETWHTFDFGKSRIWGECLRIKKYGERGDIAMDDETKDLIAEIKKQMIR